MNEPNAVDWGRVGVGLQEDLNDLRRQLHLPETPVCREDGLPSEEWLDSMEKISPGAREKLERMARTEMEFRLKAARRMRKIDLISYVVIVVSLSAIIFSLVQGTK
jgi:uncharacterized membrane protein